MSAVDFESWAIPALELTLGGRTFVVPPPSVEDSKKLLAAAVHGEVQLGLVKGEIPAEVQTVFDTIGPDERPALGPAYAEMVAAGIHPKTIDRMAYYAVFYWVRGRAYADTLVSYLWGPGGEAEESDGDRPKAQPTSRPKNGRATGSANPSTTTRTASPSTPTTGSPRKP